MTGFQAGWPLSFEMHLHCKKHLVFVDEHGAKHVLPELQRLSNTGYCVECNFVSTAVNEEFLGCVANALTKRSWSDVKNSHAFKAYLEEQPMGTHLYVAATWGMTRGIVHIAKSVGYGREEIQVRTCCEQKYQQVFCISCYTINPISDASYVTCQNCGTVLSVSEHYSRRFDAVLGYITLKNHLEKGNS